MEHTLGRLPDWMRGGRPEADEYGDIGTVLKKCPALLADFLRHLLRYDPSERASAHDVPGTATSSHKDLHTGSLPSPVVPMQFA